MRQGEINSKFKIKELLPPAKTASSFPMPNAQCPMTIDYPINALNYELGES
jgi:hypothetical protein